MAEKREKRKQIETAKKDIRQQAVKELQGEFFKKLGSNLESVRSKGRSVYTNGRGIVDPYTYTYTDINDDFDDDDLIYNQPPTVISRRSVFNQTSIKEKWKMLVTFLNLVIFIIIGLRVALTIDPLLGTFLIIIGLVVSLKDYFIRRRFFQSKTD